MMKTVCNNIQLFLIKVRKYVNNDQPLNDRNFYVDCNETFDTLYNEKHIINPAKE